MNRVKRNVIVIGIGAGNPDYMTIQAVKAMNRASVFFIPDKGSQKTELARLRREICERFIEGDNYRTVHFEVPERDKSASSYAKGVAQWREEVESTYERLLIEELGEGDCGGFLIWGDPSLYDGTIRILERISSRGSIRLEYEVIPGISSVQALAARHRTALNRIGQSIMVTTGRRLAQGYPDNADSVVVMLDAGHAFKSVDGEFDIHWGAYVGTQDEILVSGKVGDVGGEIERLRSEARSRHGWIMDTYLLSRPRESGEE